jgi:N-methylhydantoinase B/oxoprolinase/acetone carboxylase alpha subunit
MINYNQIELSLERICEQGCRSVNQIIQKIENGELVELIRHLNDSQQKILLKELKSIMAVYGKTGSCELK